jgi:WD40 repeat protein
VLTLPGHFAGTTGLAFSRDGQTIISSGQDRALRFWRVSDGDLIRAVPTGVADQTLAISPDRTIVAVEGSGTTVRLYSALDGTLLRTTVSVGNVTSLSFSGDGSLLAAGAGNDVSVFRVADAGLARTLNNPNTINVQGVSFAPNGTTLAAGSGFSHTIDIWDAATGTLRTTFDQETGWGPFPQLPLAFSPDGSLGFGRGDATVALARL